VAVMIVKSNVYSRLIVNLHRPNVNGSFELMLVTPEKLRMAAMSFEPSLKTRYPPTWE